MDIYRYPSKEQWAEIVSRPRLDLTQLNDTVRQVLDDVRQRGDEAVKDYEQKFDKVSLDSLAVTSEEIEAAAGAVGQGDAHILHAVAAPRGVSIPAQEVEGLPHCLYLSAFRRS